MIGDMDDLLSSRKEFLLGRWLEDAKAMGETEEEKALYEKDARDLITLWGNKDCRIRDYACKHWSGLMNGFYRPRWERFFDEVLAAMEAGKPFDQEAFVEGSKDWEWNWVVSDECYPTETSADEIEESLSIYKKYRKAMDVAYDAGVEGVDKEMI